MWLTESKKYINKWKDILYSWIRDNIDKIAILLKEIYIFNAIIIKIRNGLFWQKQKVI